MKHHFLGFESKEQAIAKRRWINRFVRMRLLLESGVNAQADCAFRQIPKAGSI